MNDAPALKRADVGIAVEGSTDAARAASDMVLTEPGLSVIVDAMLIARGVFQRMLSFLTYRVSATLQLVFFFFIAVFALPPRSYATTSDGRPVPEFFNLPVLMFMLITLLNDGTLMAIGYDRVVPQPRPQKWNLPALFFIAAVLAGVACVSSLLLLWMSLDALADYNHSWLSTYGIPPIAYSRIITAVYLKVSISDFLTLFSARTQNEAFFAYAPSRILTIAAASSLFVSTLAATFWPPGTIDGMHVAGLARAFPGESMSDQSKLLPLYIWLYCLVWWFIQDGSKMLAYRAMYRWDWFKYRTFMDVGDCPQQARRAVYADGMDVPMIDKASRGGYGTL